MQYKHRAEEWFHVHVALNGLLVLSIPIDTYINHFWSSSLHFHFSWRCLALIIFAVNRWLCFSGAWLYGKASQLPPKLRNTDLFAQSRSWYEIWEYPGWSIVFRRHRHTTLRWLPIVFRSQTAQVSKVLPHSIQLYCVGLTSMHLDNVYSDHQHSVS